MFDTAVGRPVQHLCFNIYTAGFDGLWCCVFFVAFLINHLDKNLYKYIGLFTETWKQFSGEIKQEWSVGTELSHWPKSNLINLLIKLHGRGRTWTSVRQVKWVVCLPERQAQQFVEIWKRRRQKSELLLASLEILT